MTTPPTPAPDQAPGILTPDEFVEYLNDFGDARESSLFRHEHGGDHSASDKEAVEAAQKLKTHDTALRAQLAEALQQKREWEDQAAEFEGRYHREALLAEANGQPWQVDIDAAQFGLNANLEWSLNEKRRLLWLAQQGQDAMDAKAALVHTGRVMLNQYLRQGCREYLIGLIGQSGVHPLLAAGLAQLEATDAE